MRSPPLTFIHPFADGNGRLGRLWQHVILLSQDPIFQFVPVESVIRERQAKSYASLGGADRSGECTPFVEFALEALRDGLRGLLKDIRPSKGDRQSRLELAQAHFGDQWFSRADYLQLHKRLSTASASRDLAEAVQRELVERQGDKRLSTYRFSPPPKRSR